MSEGKSKGAVYEYPGRNTKTFAMLPGYRNLVVWQKASELAHLVHEATRPHRPGYYRLKSQTLDAAESVPANIAEGYCRGSIGNYVRYCEIARGSVDELGTHLHTCERWGLINPAQLPAIIAFYSDVRFLLDRLLSALREKQAEKSWDSSYSVRENGPSYGVSTTTGEIEEFHQSYDELETP